MAEGRRKRSFDFRYLPFPPSSPCFIFGATFCDLTFVLQGCWPLVQSSVLLSYPASCWALMVSFVFDYCHLTYTSTI